MSDAKAYRDKMKAKAKRLAGESDATNVDASDWKPSEKLNADVKTGARPVSKQARPGRKHGGKIDGNEAPKSACRTPRRAAGGNVGTSIANTDVKKANEDREGTKKDGGFKKGGRTGKLYGGGLYGMENTNNGSKFIGARKNGGKVKKANGGPLDNDAMVGPMLNQKSGGSEPTGSKNPPKGSEADANETGNEAEVGKMLNGMKKGGRAKRATGGGVMGYKSGGKTSKGKTNINIVINAKPEEKKAAMPLPAMPPMLPKPPVPMPPPGMPAAAPGGVPAMAHSPAAPPPAALAGLGGPGGPGGAPNLAALAQPRKNGGHVFPKMKYGAGSGEGRLEKAEKYGE